MAETCLVVIAVFASIVVAQGRPQGTGASQSMGGPQNPLIREGVQLDLHGKGAEARQAFQKAIDTAQTAQAKANAERAMAISWAFEGNCKKTADYENKIIDYWKTQEKNDASHAFYQEGEAADEAARVCVDTGDLETALQLYRQGRTLGQSEPNISPARKDVWEYRWEIAHGRIAARKGDKPAAERDIAEAKKILDRMKHEDSELHEQQKTFLPYFEGYVAYYTGDYKGALEYLQQANQRDPFIQCLLGMTYEKLGEKDKAKEAYQKAAQTNAHNPPAAFAKPFATKKLASA